MYLHFDVFEQWQQGYNEEIVSLCLLMIFTNNFFIQLVSKKKLQDLSLYYIIIILWLP